MLRVGIRPGPASTAGLPPGDTRYSCRRPRWWPFRHSPGRYCAAHAVCPVLIVPPHLGIRELGRMWRRWHWLRRRREFSSLTAGISP
jgi:hypothetical protein